MEQYDERFVTSTGYMVTLKDVVEFLKDIDSPLGDLCYDILKDKNFPFENVESSWRYLNLKRYGKDYLDEPIRRLKTIYSTIVRS